MIDEVPFAQRTLPALLERGATNWGERTLVRAGDAERSYAETIAAVSARAATLTAAGVTPGDRVAMLAANRIEFLDLVLACAWLGAIAVPINVESRGAQLEHVLTNSEPVILVGESARLANLELVERFPSSLKHLWLLDPGEGSQDLGDRLRNLPIAPSPLPAATGAAEAGDVAPGDTMAILYTSGTTGVSKGVCCPHAQFYWWGRLTSQVLDVGEQDVLHTALPIFHTNALNTFFQAMYAGATFSFVERFSASRFWAQARASKATVTYLLGAIVHILLKQPATESDRDHGVRTALSPGTPLDDVERFARRFGVRLVDGYGSTETNLVLANVVGGYRPGTLGRPVPGFEIRVVDETDDPVPDGTPGQLLVRHSEAFSIATGYLNMPQATVDAWRNLWFHTGDRVVRDIDGVIRFLDRMKDMIRRRGENVSSFEVEQVLLSHPDVAHAAVVPVAAEVGDEEVLAFLVARFGATIDPAEVRRYCKPHLPSFALPRFVELVSSLPLTENGKVQKHVLRERGVGPKTWDSSSVAPH